MLPGRWSHRDSRTPTAVNTTRRVLTFPSTLGNVAEPCPFHVPRRKSNCSGKTCELPERADNLVRSQGPYRPALRFSLSLGLSLRFLRRPAFGSVFGRLCRRSSPASRRHFFPLRATSIPSDAGTNPGSSVRDGHADEGRDRYRSRSRRYACAAACAGLARISRRGADPAAACQPVCAGAEQAPAVQAVTIVIMRFRR